MHIDLYAELLITLIFAVALLVYGLCIPTKKPEAAKPTSLSMPNPETFETLSYKNYGKARRLEGENTIPAPKHAAHKSSIEHLDHVSNRYARILNDDDEI